MKKICWLVFFAAVLTLGAAETLTVTRNGDDVLIQSSFPGGYTLNRTGWAKGPNKQFNFRRTTLSKKGMKEIMVKNSGDDACPWNLNGTYIGANHGDSIASAVIFTKPHGLTEKDCGSEWTDSKGKKFYVLKIEKPTIFWVLSENHSKEKDIWKFSRPKAGDTLTHADGRVLKDFKVQYRQLYSPVRILSRKYSADGKPMEDKSKVECSVFSVEEEYDIVATDAILKHVLANPGKQVAFNAPELDRVLSQKIVYSFYPDASCIIIHQVRFHRDARLGYMGFIQAIQMTKGAYGKHLYYIPKVLPFQHDNREWDFANLEDYTKPIKKSILLKSNTFENPQSMPERFIQYLKEGKDQPDIGFVTGYSLTEGCTVPEQRSKGAATALFLYRTHKTYPHAIDGGKIKLIKAGQTFYCMAYRQYFDPNQGYYLNRQGKYQVMYIDFHAPEQNKVIPLPEGLRGKTMELLEKSPTVQYRQTAEGICFDSTGKYGYCVLKFH